MRCYCPVCQKTAGTGGYAINLGADHRTLKVTGKRHLRVYPAQIIEGDQARQSTGQRNQRFEGYPDFSLKEWREKRRQDDADLRP